MGKNEFFSGIANLCVEAQKSGGSEKDVLSWLLIASAITMNHVGAASAEATDGNITISAEVSID